MSKIIIGTEPRWTVPTLDELVATVDARQVRRIEDNHGGLSSIKIEAHYMNNAGDKLGAPVQTFVIDSGGQGRVPALTPAILARLVYHRAKIYADKKGRKVQFVIMLYGSGMDKKDWDVKYTFTVDGTPDEVVDVNGDDGDDDQNGDDGGGDADEEGGGENDADRDDDDQRTRSVAPRLPFIADMIGPSHAQRDAGALVPTGHPAMAMQHPTLDAARVVQLAYGGALQEQRAFIGQLRKDQQVNNAEIRTTFERGITLMRDSHQDVLTRVCGAYDKMLEEKESTLTEIKAIVKETLEFSRSAQAEAVARATSAEDRLRERDRQDHMQTDRLFEIAKRGWDAFGEGMAMKTDVINERREFDQAFLGSQLQASQRGQQRSAISGLADKVLPYLPVGLATYLRNKGDEKTAALVDTIAMALMPQQQMAAPAPPSGFDPGAMQTEEPLPEICVSIRELRGSMSDQQAEALRAAMPAMAWKSLEEACRTDLDAACFACLTSLERFLTSDPGITGRVQALLQPVQIMRLMGIIAFLKGAAPRPPTNANAAEMQAQQGHTASPPPEPPRPAGRPFSAPPGTTSNGAPRGVPRRPGSAPTTDEGAPD